MTPTQHHAGEFRFLASDAEHVGRKSPLPTVERVNVQVSEGRSLSALTYIEPGRGRVRESKRPPRYVFLHGAGLNAHTFDRTILALHANAISLDLPGHGHSDWRDDADYHPENLSVDVSIALRELAVEPVHLIGHSLGALTAGLVAAECEGLVDRLSIVDITPGVTPPADGRGVSEFITGKRDFGSIEEIVDRAIEFGIGSDRGSLQRGVELNTRRRPDGRLEWTHHFAHLDGLPSRSRRASAGSSPQHAEGAEQLGGVLDASADNSQTTQPYADLWSHLTRFEGGTALIRATDGMVTNEMVDEWRERLPEGTVHTLAGGHNLHEHAPVELAKTLTDLEAQ